MTTLSRRTFTAALGATLLTACGAAGEGPRTTGPATTDGTGEPNTSPTGTTSGTPTSGGAGTGGSTGTSAGNSTSDSQAAADAPHPTRLLIPSIAVNTPLLTLGLSADGTVEVPPITAHDQAGWYRYSPPPGHPGPAVLLGHVTVGEFGDGVFRHLARLRLGDGVTVRLSDGQTKEFEVTRVKTVAKSEFPTAEVYGDVARPELRLITCGGPHDGVGYRDNVIVFAVLKGA